MMHDIPTPARLAEKKQTPVERALSLMRIGERLDEDIRAFSVDQDDLKRAGLPDVEFPVNSGLNGGAARNILEALVHNCHITRPPRDIDLLALTYSAEDRSRLQHFSKTLYEEGVIAESHPLNASGEGWLKHYMAAHDFTINQVLYIADGDGGGTFYCTDQALRDMATTTIRPTVYEEEVYEQDGKRSRIVRDRIALKALRLAAEYQADGIDATIEGINFKYGIRHSAREPFQNMLSLHKILERGIDATREYMKLLRRYGFAQTLDPHVLASQLEAEVWDFSFSAKAVETLNHYNAAPPRLTEKVGHALGVDAVRTM